MFHVTDGLCFERQPDGSVRVLKLKPATQPTALQDMAIEMEVTFNRAAFASVVASMSQRGETAETFYEALGFLQIEPR